MYMCIKSAYFAYKLNTFSCQLVFCDPSIKRSWHSSQEGRKKSSLGCCWPSCWLWGVFKPGYTHRLPTVYTVLIKHKPFWDLPTHLPGPLFSAAFNISLSVTWVSLEINFYLHFIVNFPTLFCFFCPYLHISTSSPSSRVWCNDEAWPASLPPTGWAPERSSAPVCDQSLWLYLTLQGGVVASSCVSAWVVGGGGGGLAKHRGLPLAPVCLVNSGGWSQWYF